MRATLATVLLPLAMLVSSATVSASDTYPQHVADKLGLECTPGCQLCHLDTKGGPGKINSFFGSAAKLNGLRQLDLPSLDTALAMMAADMTLDSDKDMVGDIAELLAATDPNGDGELCIGPKYGCGASTITRAASKRGLDPAATVAGSLMVGLGLLLLRRRR